MNDLIQLIPISHIGGPISLPVPDIPQVIARYQKLFGTNFVWELMTEDDSSGVGLSRTLFREQPRAHAATKQFFGEHLGTLSDSRSGLDRVGAVSGLNLGLSAADNSGSVQADVAGLGGLDGEVLRQEVIAERFQ